MAEPKVEIVIDHVDKYWKAAGKLAWKSIAKDKKLEDYMITAVTIIFVYVIVEQWLGMDKAIENEKYVISGALAAILGFGILFLHKLFHAPFEMDKERQAAIQAEKDSATKERGEAEQERKRLEQEHQHILSDEKKLRHVVEKELEQEKQKPATIDVRTIELQRTPIEKKGYHIFLRVKIELQEVMKASVDSYRLELSRNGVVSNAESVSDVDKWEITDWTQNPIPHEDMRPLPMHLTSGSLVEAWGHFTTDREANELDESYIRFYVHSTHGTGMRN